MKLKHKTEKELLDFHNSINKRYFESKAKVEFVRDRFQDFNFWGQVNRRTQTITYRVDCVRDLYKICLHEFAHLLQNKYLLYTEHDLIFSLIYNVLSYRELKDISINSYDLHEDRAALDASFSFASFSKIVTHLSELPIAQACTDAQRWAIYLLNGFWVPPDFDTPTPEEITEAELAQVLGY